jgi:hypothetical protein
MPLLFAADGELLAAGNSLLSARWLRETSMLNGRLHWQRQHD